MPFGEQFHIDIKKPTDPWDSTVNPDQWLSATEATLRKIATVNAGKMLLQAVLDSGFFIAVEPLNWAACNAHGAARFTISNGKTYKGAVKFDPAVFTKGSSCFKSRLAEKYDRGGHPDEVLFHELIHALRGGLAVNDKKTLSGGLWRYNNTEEFFAVVLTNIYISDETNKGSSGLRAGHRGKMPLEKYFSHSLCFFGSSPQILPLMRQFESDHKRLFENLAKVKAAFNPIRMMVENPRAVERMSRAKATLAHERGAEKHQRWIEDKRLAEVRASIAAHKALDEKHLEAFLASLANATPEQMAEQLGALGAYAADILKKVP